LELIHVSSTHDLIKKLSNKKDLALSAITPPISGEPAKVKPAVKANPGIKRYAREWRQ
jgi:hypothetical protein